jgi:hypothetical protein
MAGKLRKKMEIPDEKGGVINVAPGDDLLWVDHSFLPFEEYKNLMRDLKDKYGEGPFTLRKIVENYSGVTMFTLESKRGDSFDLSWVYFRKK